MENPRHVSFRECRLFLTEKIKIGRLQGWSGIIWWENALLKCQEMFTPNQIFSNLQIQNKNALGIWKYKSTYSSPLMTAQLIQCYDPAPNLRSRLQWFNLVDSTPLDRSTLSSLQVGRSFWLIQKTPTVLIGDHVFLVQTKIPEFFLMNEIYNSWIQTIRIS